MPAARRKSYRRVAICVDRAQGYGTTILPGSPVTYKQGDDEAMAKFVAEAGSLGAIIFFNCNPVYDHPMGAKLAAALKGVELTISTNYKEDETGSLAAYKAPDHHFLEAWNDAEPKKGSFSLGQPTITPIFKTRAAQESFLIWAGESNVDYFEIVKNNWNTWFAPGTSGLEFQAFWDKCLYDGVFEKSADASAAVAAFGRTRNAAGRT